jgi:hypothetical protein
MALQKVIRNMLSTGVSDSSDATAITIDSSENVGIGVTSAYTGGKLSLNGGLVQPSGNQHVIGVYGTSGLQLIGTTGGDNIVGTMGSSEPLIFRTVSAERMRIDTSGNVGIGGSPTNYSDHKTLSLYGNTGTGAGFIEFNDTSGNADAVIFSDDGNLFINADYDNTAADSSIRFRVDGSSEKMRIDSGGRVMIAETSNSGYSATADDLIVGDNGSSTERGISLGSTAGATIRFNDGADAGLIEYAHSDNSMRLYTAGTERMRIDSDGDLKISGTFGGNSSTAFASMAGRLTFDTDYSDTQRGPNKVVLQEDGAWIAGLGISNDSTDFYSGGHMTFRTGTSLGTERMRIISGGDVCIGKTTNDIDTQGWHVIGAGTYSGSVYSGITGAVSTSTYHLRDTTNNTWKFYVENNGTIRAISTSISALSDERLKENVVDLETGLTEVMSLKPRRFDWKEGEGSCAKNVAGFVAQEVETVLPDLIENFMHDDLDDAKSVRMGDMIPTLVKAIQELKAEIEELKK